MTPVLACCALHNFLCKRSLNYSPPEAFDREHFEDGTTMKGERCNPDKIHHLQRRSGGTILKSAKIVQKNVSDYFNNEGSLPWQDKFALNF